MFPDFFHWMSRWMSLPATWIFQRPPGAQRRRWIGILRWPVPWHPRWTPMIQRSGISTMRRSSAAAMWRMSANVGQGKKGPFKTGLKRGKNTCWVMDFKEFLLFSAMGHWNILEYIGIWVIYDGNYIDLDGLLWYKNWDIFGGRVRYWWDMNGRAYFVCCFFLQMGYLSQAMAMLMGKTDDKPWYSGVSYFCWTDPTRFILICLAIFANDSGPASGT